MKPLKNLGMVVLIALLATACQKKQATPACASAATQPDRLLRGPNIVALSITHYYSHGGGSNFDVQFDSGTASFYGSTLYMHYKTSAATLYSSGTSVSVWASPVATYALPVSLSPGTYNMFFSDGTGTSYPAGAAASPIYTITI